MEEDFSGRTEGGFTGYTYFYSGARMRNAHVRAKKNLEFPENNFIFCKNQLEIIHKTTSSFTENERTFQTIQQSVWKTGQKLIKIQ